MFFLLLESGLSRMLSASAVILPWMIWYNRASLMSFLWPFNNSQVMGHLEQGKSEGFDNCDRPSNLTQIGFKSSIFHPVWLEIWWMTLNKANLRDLIAATGLVISNWIQIVNFSACVTVKFDGWPCNTIGHLFYATSSFVHHFVAIGEFKLQLQSGNAQSGSNSTIFRGVRPWNLMDDLAKQ